MSVGSGISGACRDGGVGRSGAGQGSPQPQQIAYVARCLHFERHVARAGEHDLIGIGVHGCCDSRILQRDVRGGTADDTGPDLGREACHPVGNGGTGDQSDVLRSG